MTLDELRRSKRDEILRIATKHGASNVRVFGSIARGENSPESDIDILVDLERDRSLMDLGGLLMDLQEVLSARVDVATEKMLRPKIREKGDARRRPAMRDESGAGALARCRRPRRHFCESKSSRFVTVRGTVAH